MSVDCAPEKTPLSTYTREKNVVIFGLPGAFTPVCSSTHVPDFVRAFDALKAKGFDDVICISVNDPFVMDAWKKDTNADPLIFLADPYGEWLKKMDLLFDGTALGLGWRSKRFCLTAHNEQITSFFVEPSPNSCSISSATHILKQLT